MKVLSPQQIKEHDAASVRGAIEGTLVSGLLTGGGSYVLHRRSAYYRSLPPSLKLLGVVIVVAPCLAIQAERRGLEYDRSQWSRPGGTELDKRAAAEKLRAERLNLSSRMMGWADRHKWGIVVGSWATGMAVSGAVISKNRYQTFGQKLVQARMWAQGLTIAVLIAAAVLSQSQRAAAAENDSDHSWQLALEDQAKEEEEFRVNAVKRVAR